MTVEFNLSLPYMTVPEASAFESYLRSGRVTIFRSAQCEAAGCEKLVPRVKRFCSVVCYRKEEGVDDVEDEEQEEETAGPMG